MIPSLRAEPFWMRTPPALGPVCLGLLGCGLAWRLAADTLGAPTAIGELWSGAALAVLAFCLGAYLMKAVTRPGALAFDLRMPAGRGAVPAFTMAVMLAAAAVAPVAPGLAQGLWWLGVAAHLAVAAELTRELIATTPDGRPATPGLLVPFAGQIVAPLGGAPLGFPAASWLLFLSALAAWAVVAPLALRRLLRAASPPPPMRAAAFILLAPPSVGAVSAEALDPGGPLGPALFAVACLTLIGLLARLRWLTAGGWSPGWGAFTFPSAAFSGAALTMAERWPGLVQHQIAALALTLASLVTLWIAFRTASSWARGTLAPR